MTHIAKDVQASVLGDTILAQNNALAGPGGATFEELTSELGGISPYDVDVKGSLLDRIENGPHAGAYVNAVADHISQVCREKRYPANVKAKLLASALTPEALSDMNAGYAGYNVLATILTEGPEGITDDIGHANIAGALSGMTPEQLGRLLVSFNQTEMAGEHFDHSELFQAPGISTELASSQLHEAIRQGQAKIEDEADDTNDFMVLIESAFVLRSFLEHYRPDAIAYIQEYEPDALKTLNHLVDRENADDAELIQQCHISWEGP